MMILSIRILFFYSAIFFNYADGQLACDAAIDLSLIIDSSGSIPASDFQKSKDALADIVQRLNIGAKAASVAIINYSSNMTLSAQSNIYETDKTEVLAQINSLPHLGSKTATGAALNLAKKYCEARCRDIKQGIPRVFAIFTDGHSNEGPPVKPAAQAIRDPPIEGDIFAIGIGNIGAKGEQELITIAGDQANVLHISSYADLIRAANAIATEMCDFPAFITPDLETRARAAANKTRYYKMRTPNKPGKNAFFEIEVKDTAGQSVVYTSTTNRKPTSLSSKAAVKRGTGGSNIYTTYVTGNAKNFYFAIKGLKPTTNEADFIVRVIPF